MDGVTCATSMPCDSVGAPHAKRLPVLPGDRGGRIRWRWAPTGAACLMVERGCLSRRHGLPVIARANHDTVEVVRRRPLDADGSASRVDIA